MLNDCSGKIRSYDLRALRIYQIAPSSRINNARAMLMIDFETMQKPMKITSSFIFILLLLPHLRHRDFSFLHRVSFHLLPLVSLVIVARTFQYSHLLVIFSRRGYSMGHANFAIVSSNGEKGSRLHFDRRGITVADASIGVSEFLGRGDVRRLKRK